MSEKLREHYHGEEESFQKLKNKLEKQADLLVRKYQKDNNASDGETALEALSIYKTHLLDPPEWAVNKIRESWELFRDGVIGAQQWPPNETQINTFRTLDEAFGMTPRIHIKSVSPRSVAAIQKKERLLPFVYQTIKSLYDSGMKFDKEGTIYSEAGKKFGISGSTVHDYYEEAKDLGYPTISGQPRRKK